MFNHKHKLSSSVIMQYIKDVKTVLPCYGKQEKAFIKYLKQQLTDYLDQNTSITYKEGEDSIPAYEEDTIITYY